MITTAPSPPIGLFTRLANRYDHVESEYLYDPVAWAEDRLSAEVWSRQGDLMDAVADHRHTAVRSAHSTGKSWAAAVLTAWWLDVHPPSEAFVVTSAPTQPQVEAVLWREIGRAHAKGRLEGRITSGAVPMWKLGQEIVAYGRKPADYRDAEKAMQSFQGIHARYILVILDEACGIPKWLWDATEALATNEDSRVLAIGNPDDPSSHFAKVCSNSHREGTGWHKIKITAFDTPAFTGEDVSDFLAKSLVSKLWVKERAERWGVGSMLYTSKVEAEFPEVSSETLITPAMLFQAQQNYTLLGELNYDRLSCDVARYGDDKTVIGRNRGGVFTVLRVVPKASTMHTAGIVAQYIRKFNGYVAANIDVIGLGAGVYDRLEEQGLPVVAINSSESAHDKTRYRNRRAELWWKVRTQMENGELGIDPDDEDLAGELTAIRMEPPNSAGQIVIEKKEETKKRLGRSPDRADTLMMSCDDTADWSAPVLDPREKKNTTGVTDGLMRRAM